MDAGARTPEELETLLENAFVLHDPQALVLAGHAINVVRRDDGSWRYAISLLDLCEANKAITAPSTTPR
jgi:hypothetical protein